MFKVTGGGKYKIFRAEPPSCNCIFCPVIYQTESGYYRAVMMRQSNIVTLNVITCNYYSDRHLVTSLSRPRRFSPTGLQPLEQVERLTVTDRSWGEMCQWLAGLITIKISLVILDIKPADTRPDQYLSFREQGRIVRLQSNWISSIVMETNRVSQNTWCRSLYLFIGWYLP